MENVIITNNIAYLIQNLPDYMKIAIGIGIIIIILLIILLLISLIIVMLRDLK